MEYFVHFNYTKDGVRGDGNAITTHPSGVREHEDIKEGLQRKIKGLLELDSVVVSNFILLEDGSEKLHTDEATRGLNDHEIAEVTNAVTTLLHQKLSNTPQCLRELVRGAVIGSLEEQGLRPDRRIKSERNQNSSGTT